MYFYLHHRHAISIIKAYNNNNNNYDNNNNNNNNLYSLHKKNDIII